MVSISAERDNGSCLRYTLPALLVKMKRGHGFAKLEISKSV